MSFLSRGWLVPIHCGPAHLSTSLPREIDVPARFWRSSQFWWLCLLGLAVLLRLGVIVSRPSQLTIDRDLYLGIAEGIRAGHGYSTPGSLPPAATAFRSPLYPMLLVLTGGSPVGIAGLHVLLAVCMVLATGKAARKLVEDAGRSVSLASQFLAGGIVAFDPLLLLYSSQPMTETLCSCLTAVLLCWLSGSQKRTNQMAIVEGVIWGLCLLARPTYAVAFGLSLLGRGILVSEVSKDPLPIPPRQQGWHAWFPRWRVGIVMLVVTLGVVSPWAIRNWMVFGKPIVTTTHGGYTLWLANNPIYYSEVIEGDDAVWDGKSLGQWQAETDAEMDRLHIQGEVARDRWLSTHAQRFIRDNPWRFVRACLHRAEIFWSIFPGRSADAGVPLPMLWVMAGGYAALWVGGIVALGRLRSRERWASAWPALSLILGFFVVHLVYWTDVRMRAPIMPAVAVLLAVGVSPTRRKVGESNSPAGR